MTDSNHTPESDSVPVDHAFVCEECGHRWYYTRRRCPDCAGTEHSTYELEVGELLAWTENRVTPADIRSPNRLGLARFGEVQLIAQLSDGEVSVGDRIAFEGDYQLRRGSEAQNPRLTPVE
ncbi:Zn-ribbon domain-containing OB-fold protein [Natrarchaeobius sp. A-rgal3]|uniref:Zn-ribbon domain-containing OB-fold protein n=1 Tax=Natrarchaeobius versutus TaxID=1679078 RepID=UPI00350FEE99